ncbi:MAG: hypothetical protein ACI8P9_005502 [Parasphingorhabdus sp.]|jgi:hypothetical protein
MTDANSRSSSRATLLILLAVFLAPLVGGYSWYFFGDNFRTKNYGELFIPARLVTDIQLQDQSGGITSIESLTGMWTIMYVGPSDCQQACLSQLDKVSRMRYMQGERIQRIQNIFIADGDPERLNLGKIQEVLKPGKILSLSEGNRSKLTHLFTRESETGKNLLYRIYLLDPIGNLVLSYPVDADLAKIRKDLSRLMRISQIG